MGKMVPILLQEVLPGDSFRVNTESLIRLSPLTAPMMHRLDVYTHYFFVPNRLVWDDWEKFITGGEKGEFLHENLPVMPQLVIGLDDSHGARSSFFNIFRSGSLADYMGVPTFFKSTDTVNSVTSLLTSYEIPNISMLPFRAYQLIFNEYYRDQNLESEIPISKASGLFKLLDLDVQHCFYMRTRNWRKDYFTSALPTSQKGPDISFGSNIIVNPESNRFTRYFQRTIPGPMAAGAAYFGGDSDNAGFSNLKSGSTSGVRSVMDPNGTLQAAVSMTGFRRAISLTRWLERNSRSGSRYTEFLMSHFGVRSRDERLQRPEYLGGGRSPIVVSEVVQTSETSNTPQGTLAGHGLGVGNTHSFKKYFTEHGFIIGIMTVMPEPTYCNTLDKSLIRNDPFDYFFPEFAHIGEQEVINGEVFWDFKKPLAGVSSRNPKLFGYQSRFAEYKYKASTVHGDFKNSMHFWTMSRMFDVNTKPNLNAAFIKCNPRYDPFAVKSSDIDHLWVQLYHNIQAIRPIPIFSEPF